MLKKPQNRLFQHFALPSRKQSTYSSKASQPTSSEASQHPAKRNGTKCHSLLPPPSQARALLFFKPILITQAFTLHIGQLEYAVRVLIERSEINCLSTSNRAQRALLFKNPPQ